jgi:hypothetical protein
MGAKQAGMSPELAARLRTAIVAVEALRPNELAWIVNAAHRAMVEARRTVETDILHAERFPPPLDAPYLLTVEGMVERRGRYIAILAFLDALRDLVTVVNAAAVAASLRGMFGKRPGK